MCISSWQYQAYALKRSQLQCSVINCNQWLSHNNFNITVITQYNWNICVNPASSPMAKSDRKQAGFQYNSTSLCLILRVHMLLVNTANRYHASSQYGQKAFLPISNHCVHIWTWYQTSHVCAKPDSKPPHNKYMSKIFFTGSVRITSLSQICDITIKRLACIQLSQSIESNYTFLLYSENTVIPVYCLISW